MGKWEQAIDDLHSAFADVPRPPRIVGCPCCISVEEAHHLLAMPLRKISPDELSRYAISALSTVGVVADYLYFLPRILEISATEFFWWPDVEITGRAIGLTDPGAWPDPRQQALRSFLAAVIDHVIESGAYGLLDHWLCATGRMTLDVRPYLVQIARHGEAVLGYFTDNANGLPKRKLCNHYWELPSRAHDTIVNWFYSKEIRRIPTESYGYAWD